MHGGLHRWSQKITWHDVVNAQQNLSTDVGSNVSASVIRYQAGQVARTHAVGVHTISAYRSALGSAYSLPTPSVSLPHSWGNEADFIEPAGGPGCCCCDHKAVTFTPTSLQQLPIAR